MCRFRERRFPTDWAKVVNGVGLVSLAMSAEGVFGDMEGHWNPKYLRRTGLAQATASDLNAMLDGPTGRCPPPPERTGYFDELRTLARDGVGLIDAWWQVDRSSDDRDPT